MAIESQIRRMILSCIIYFILTIGLNFGCVKYVSSTHDAKLLCLKFNLPYSVTVGAQTD